MSLAVPRLIHTGQVLVDLIMRVGALPPPGGDVLASEARFEVGGGFNVIAAARRSGMACVYAGGHGTGRFGELARQALAAEGAELAAPRVLDRDTGICVAIVDASTERTFVTHLGAEAVLERDVLDALAVTPRDIVYVTGYGLCVPDKGALLADWLETLPESVVVAFDPGPLVDSIESALLARVMRRTRIWTGNREEALRHTGRASVEAALDELAVGSRFRRVWTARGDAGHADGAGPGGPRRQARRRGDRGGPGPRRVRADGRGLVRGRLGPAAAASRRARHDGLTRQPPAG
ncbi:PfkB family carbohydrate kinase, partial [Burkholderia sp. Ax-1720]|uniref:PfkB family carbohydrate kinase n=1 Tax=Burkholderia sp. Ax-1720 TaxID=2608335 RepID=UPI001F03C707